MDSMNKQKNKIFKGLFIAAIAALSLIALVTIISPLTREFGNLANSILYAILLPVVFVLGAYCKTTIKIKNLLIGVGVIFAALVLLSDVATWTQYGLFHTAIYKDTPIYYLNATPYNVTEEVLFFSNLSFKEVSINYAGTFQVIVSMFLPAAFLLDRKSEKKYFITSLVIGSIGLFSLISVPNLNGIYIVAIVWMLTLLYKIFINNKVVKNIYRYSLLGLFAIACLFYLIAGINACLGFKMTGFLETIFETNPIMKNVSVVIARDENFINLFGLDSNLLTNNNASAIISTKTGIFEVEILKDIGIVGVILTFLFILISFKSISKTIEDSKLTVFEKLTSIMIIGSFFIYTSLFYDAMPYVFEGIYVPFFRYLPTLFVVFVLSFMFYVPERKEKKNEK